jgi:hypothetical protein
VRAKNAGIRLTDDAGRLRMINVNGSKLSAAAQNARLSGCPEYNKAAWG